MRPPATRSPGSERASGDYGDLPGVGSRLQLPDLATRAQVAEYTQTSVPTLARWAGEGTGPRFIKLGNSVRYPRAALLAWLDSLAAGGEAG